MEIIDSTSIPNANHQPPITFTAEQQATVDQIVAERLSKQHARLNAETEKAKSEAALLRKRSAQREAMGDLFLPQARKAVEVMTDNAGLGITVEQDKTGNYIVREKGQIKLNASLEPMTLSEFYAEFAVKNPKMANVHSGSGSRQDGKVRSKSDLKTVAEKHSFIIKRGIRAYEMLPLK